MNLFNLFNKQTINRVSELYDVLSVFIKFTEIRRRLIFEHFKVPSQLFETKNDEDAIYASICWIIGKKEFDNFKKIVYSYNINDQRNVDEIAGI